MEISGRRIRKAWEGKKDLQLFVIEKGKQLKYNCKAICGMRYENQMLKGRDSVSELLLSTIETKKAHDLDLLPTLSPWTGQWVWL